MQLDIELDRYRYGDYYGDESNIQRVKNASAFEKARDKVRKAAWTDWAKSSRLREAMSHIKEHLEQNDDLIARRFGVLRRRIEEVLRRQVVRGRGCTICKRRFACLAGAAVGKVTTSMNPLKPARVDGDVIQKALDLLAREHNLDTFGVSFRQRYLNLVDLDRFFDSEEEPVFIGGRSIFEPCEESELCLVLYLSCSYRDTIFQNGARIDYHVIFFVRITHWLNGYTILWILLNFHSAQPMVVIARRGGKKHSFDTKELVFRGGRLKIKGRRGQGPVYFVARVIRVGKKKDIHPLKNLEGVDSYLSTNAHSQR